MGQLPTRDPVLASFWNWFESLSPGEQSQVVAPLLNKLRAFTMRPRLRNIVGQTNGLSMSDIIERQQVLLVTLNTGLLGRDATQLVGSLIVAQLWQATLQRAAVPQAQRRPFMVTIDEMQDFLRLPVDVGDMLAQARGLGVALTLAHQHLGQLPVDLKSAVLANARSRAMFRLGHDDAKALSRDLGPYLSQSDLEGLQAYEVALRLNAGGAIQPPTTGTTRNLAPARNGQAAWLRTHSARRWGTRTSDIEAAMSRRQEAGTPRSVGREPETVDETSDVQPRRIGRAAS
jgi:DNA helicase HerA-like ATPase